MSSWTLTELVVIAARALAADGVRVSSGRVAEVPNERLVRWYSTIGLVDRPMIGRGRTARYGERHLAQLVAVKRLQAQGLPLVEIQQRLLGATDAELRQVAGLPDELSEWASALPAGDGEQTHPRVGRQRRLDAGGGDPGPLASGVDPVPAAAMAGGGQAARTAEAPGEAVVPADAAPFWETRPSRTPATPAALFGVTLSGVTLLLPAQPNQNDLDAIASAAAPLIDLLASRGLLAPKGRLQ